MTKEPYKSAKGRGKGRLAKWAAEAVRLGEEERSRRWREAFGGDGLTASTTAAFEALHQPAAPAPAPKPSLAVGAQSPAVASPPEGKRKGNRREGAVWRMFIIPHMVAKIAERKAAGKAAKFRTLGAAAREAAKSMETEEAKNWLKAGGKKPLTEGTLENGIRDRHREWLVPGWTGKKGSV